MLLITSGVIPAEDAIDAQLLTVQMHRQLLEEVCGAGYGHVTGTVHLHLPTHTVKKQPGACLCVHMSTCVYVCVPPSSDRYNRAKDICMCVRQVARLGYCSTQGANRATGWRLSSP